MVKEPQQDKPGCCPPQNQALPKGTAFGAPWRIFALPNTLLLDIFTPKVCMTIGPLYGLLHVKRARLPHASCVSTELMAKLCYAYFYAPLGKESAQESPKQWPSLWPPTGPLASAFSITTAASSLKRTSDRSFTHHTRSGESIVSNRTAQLMANTKTAHDRPSRAA